MKPSKFRLKPYPVLLAVLLLILLAAAASRMFPHFQPMTGITVIKVDYANPMAGPVKYQTVRQISSPKQVARIVHFVNAYQGYWVPPLLPGETDSHGVVVLGFYKGTRFDRGWEIGPDYFVTYYPHSNIAYSKDVDRKTVNSLLNLMSLDPDVVPKSLM